MSKSKYLFMISGSIAAFKAAQVISRLVQDGHEVQTVVSPSALKFLGPMTLEGLTGRAIASDLWSEGRAMEHIQLTRWADVAVLCPASANSLAKLAHGLADDLIGALALAWPQDRPFHIFPAMNSQMLAAGATQSNLASLRTRGFRVHETNAGALACGETGEGRLMEPEDILRRLQPKPLGRILLTSGATREPIDGIRYISNVSTGQTGAELADGLSARGWQITYLHGQGAQIPRSANHRVTFSDFVDLERRLRAELDQRNYVAVIHCAAVADYSVEGAKPAVKLSSDQELTLKLKPNPKLLPRLKNYSRSRDVFVVGFKLTLGESQEATDARARALLQSSVDAVVANDWSQVERSRDRHPGRLHTHETSISFSTVTELAGQIHTLLPKSEESK